MTRFRPCAASAAFDCVALQACRGALSEGDVQAALVRQVKLCKASALEFGDVGLTQHSGRKRSLPLGVDERPLHVEAERLRASVRADRRA